MSGQDLSDPLLSNDDDNNQTVNLGQGVLSAPQIMNMRTCISNEMSKNSATSKIYGLVTNNERSFFQNNSLYSNHNDVNISFNTNRNANVSMNQHQQPNVFQELSHQNGSVYNASRIGLSLNASVNEMSGSRSSIYPGKARYFMDKSKHMDKNFEMSILTMGETTSQIGEENDINHKSINQYPKPRPAIVSEDSQMFYSKKRSFNMQQPNRMQYNQENMNNKTNTNQQQFSRIGLQNPSSNISMVTAPTGSTYTNQPHLYGLPQNDFFIPGFTQIQNGYSQIGSYMYGTQNNFSLPNQYQLIGPYNNQYSQLNYIYSQPTTVAQTLVPMTVKNNTLVPTNLNFGNHMEYKEEDIVSAVANAPPLVQNPSDEYNQIKKIQKDAEKFTDVNVQESTQANSSSNKEKIQNQFTGELGIESLYNDAQRKKIGIGMVFFSSPAKNQETGTSINYKTNKSETNQCVINKAESVLNVLNEIKNSIHQSGDENNFEKSHKKKIKKHKNHKNASEFVPGQHSLGQRYKDITKNIAANMLKFDVWLANFLQKYVNVRQNIAFTLNMIKIKKNMNSSSFIVFELLKKFSEEKPDYEKGENSSLSSSTSSSSLNSSDNEEENYEKDQNVSEYYTSEYYEDNEDYDEKKKERSLPTPLSCDVQQNEFIEKKIKVNSTEDETKKCLSMLTVNCTIMEDNRFEQNNSITQIHVRWLLRNYYASIINGAIQNIAQTEVLITQRYGISLDTIFRYSAQITKEQNINKYNYDRTELIEPNKTIEAGVQYLKEIDINSEKYKDLWCYISLLYKFMNCALKNMSILITTLMKINSEFSPQYKKCIEKFCSMFPTSSLGLLGIASGIEDIEKTRIKSNYDSLSEIEESFEKSKNNSNIQKNSFAQQIEQTKKLNNPSSFMQNVSVVKAINSMHEQELNKPVLNEVKKSLEIDNIDELAKNINNMSDDLLDESTNEKIQQTTEIKKINPATQITHMAYNKNSALMVSINNSLLKQIPDEESFESSQSRSSIENITNLKAYETVMIEYFDDLRRLKSTSLCWYLPFLIQAERRLVTLVSTKTKRYVIKITFIFKTSQNEKKSVTNPQQSASQIISVNNSFSSSSSAGGKKQNTNKLDYSYVGERLTKTNESDPTQKPFFIRQSTYAEILDAVAKYSGIIGTIKYMKKWNEFTILIEPLNLEDESCKQKEKK